MRGTMCTKYMVIEFADAAAFIKRHSSAYFSSRQPEGKFYRCIRSSWILPGFNGTGDPIFVRYPDDEALIQEDVQSSVDPNVWPVYKVHVSFRTNSFEKATDWIKQNTVTSDTSYDELSQELNEIIFGEPSPSTSSNAANSQYETAVNSHKLDWTDTHANSEGTKDNAIVITSSSTSDNSGADKNIVACLIVMLEAMVKDISTVTGEKFRLEFSEIRIVRACDNVLVREMENLKIGDCDENGDDLTENNVPEARHEEDDDDDDDLSERDETAKDASSLLVPSDSGDTLQGSMPRFPPTAASSNPARNVMRHYSTYPYIQPSLAATNPTPNMNPLHPQPANPSIKGVPQSTPSQLTHSLSSVPHYDSSRGVPQYMASNLSPIVTHYQPISDNSTNRTLYYMPTLPNMQMQYPSTSNREAAPNKSNPRRPHLPEPTQAVFD